MTALDTDSLEKPVKLHELSDSRKVVASSQAVLALSFKNARSSSDSSMTHGVCQPIFNPVFCSSLVLDMLLLHLGVVHLVVDVFLH